MIRLINEMFAVFYVSSSKIETLPNVTNVDKCGYPVIEKAGKK